MRHILADDTAAAVEIVVTSASASREARTKHGLSSDEVCRRLSATRGQCYC